MTRAVMEGVTFGLRDIYELIKRTTPDLKPTEVFSSGGASKSKVWRQIQADIFNLPVKTQTGAAEGGAYGAAVVAGVGAGIWRDIEHAAQALEEETLTMPNPVNVAVYEKLYKTYQALYTDLKNRFSNS
jgi:xylulokinase